MSITTERVRKVILEERIFELSLELEAIEGYVFNTQLSIRTQVLNKMIDQLKDRLYEVEHTIIGME